MIQSKGKIATLFNYLINYNPYIAKELIAMAHYSTSQLFIGEAQTSLYAQFRPTYPNQVFQRIISFCKEKDCAFKLALDLGCGSGQSTVPLAKYFEKVIGTDVSKQQIDKSPKDVGNINFKVSPAEQMDFVCDDSVDLVTIAQAFHWVDESRFFSEVTRVLRPGGSLVVYGYGLGEVMHQEANQCFHHIYHDILGSYWPEGRRKVEEKYRTVKLPYPGWRRDDSLTMEKECTIEEFVGYVGSWSATQKYSMENPDSNLLNDLREGLQKACSKSSGKENVDTKLRIAWPVFMLMGHKPS